MWVVELPRLLHAAYHGAAWVFSRAQTKKTRLDCSKRVKSKVSVAEQTLPQIACSTASIVAFVVRDWRGAGRQQHRDRPGRRPAGRPRAFPHQANHLVSNEAVEKYVSELAY